MPVDGPPRERLFAYGTLQLESVQLATFGWRLSGTRDALHGFELAALTIDDPAVIAVSGQAQHPMARFSGRETDVIPGTVFAVTSEEIQRADEYEVAAVKRVAVVLESGVRAWAYVDATTGTVRRQMSASAGSRSSYNATTSLSKEPSRCRAGYPY